MGGHLGPPEARTLANLMNQSLIAPKRGGSGDIAPASSSCVAAGTYCVCQLLALDRSWQRLPPLSWNIGHNGRHANHHGELDAHHWTGHYPAPLSVGPYEFPNLKLRGRSGSWYPGGTKPTSDSQPGNFYTNTVFQAGGCSKVCESVPRAPRQPASHAHKW